MAQKNRIVMEHLIRQVAENDAEKIFVMTQRIPSTDGVPWSNWDKTDTVLTQSGSRAYKKLKHLIRDLEDCGFGIDAESMVQNMDEKVMEEGRIYESCGGWPSWYYEDDEE